VKSGGSLSRRFTSVFFGWWIVLGGIGLQILTSGLINQAYGAYVVILKSQFGWSQTAFSIAFSIQQVESGVLGPLQGWLLDRFGPRFVARIGICVLAGGVMLFSQMNSLALFYVSFLVMSIGMSMAGFVTTTTTLINWFERKRGTALGIMQTGGAVGGLMVPIVAWSLVAFGWRSTAFASGIIILIAGLPLVQLLRHRPEDYGLLPDGVKPSETTEWPPASRGTVSAASPPGRVDFRPGEALRTRAFWFLSLGHGMALFLVTSMSVHLIPHLTEDRGMSLAFSASVVSMMIGGQMAGQLSGGFLGDRFDKRLIAAGAMSGHIVAMSLLAWTHSAPLAVLAAIIHGYCHGFRGVQMMPIRADYFGRAHFGTIMGFSSMVMLVGTVTGPIVAGQIFDRTGDYQIAFQIMMVVAVIASTFFLFAKRPTPPPRYSEGQPAA
jgi:MFS family permease